jgi:hypothetical protein
MLAHILFWQKFFFDTIGLGIQSSATMGHPFLEISNRSTQVFEYSTRMRLDESQIRICKWRTNSSQLV